MTGNLGDVMKESIKIGGTFARFAGFAFFSLSILCRTFLEEKEPENKIFADTRLHLHVPEGATPKVRILHW